MNDILLAIKYILTLMWKKQRKLLFTGALRSLKYLQGPWHVCQISTIPLLCDVTCQHHWQLSRCEDQGRKMNHIITCDSRSLCSVGCVWQSAQWLVEQMSECHVRAAAALSVLGLSCHKCFLYSELHDVCVLPCTCVNCHYLPSHHTVIDSISCRQHFKHNGSSLHLAYFFFSPPSHLYVNCPVVLPCRMRKWQLCCPVGNWV